MQAPFTHTIGSASTFPRRLSLRLRVLKAITVLVIIGGYRVMVWAATVTLWPGNSNNLQTAVSNNPPGTTFILQHGTYRGASVTSLKDGDSFIGQGFVDLNGSNILKGWKTVSIGGVEYWTTAGGTPLPTPACPVHSGICCEPNYPGCIYVQDLYVNNVEYQHVTSLTNVASGTWYYDYDGTDGGIQNNIYMYPGDAPNTNFVELGATNIMRSLVPHLTLPSRI